MSCGVMMMKTRQSEMVVLQERMSECEVTRIYKSRIDVVGIKGCL